MIGPLGRWSGSLAGSCVPCLRSSSVGSRSLSVGLRCSALGLLESFLGLLGCSATCWLLDPSLCLLGSPILIGWENDLPRCFTNPPTGPKNPYIPMGMGGAEQAGRPNVVYLYCNHG